MATRLIMIFPRIKNYFKENWGAPFIIAFIVLILACAGLLAFGLSSLAEDVAVYAYYMLVVGVVLQFTSYIKFERKKNASYSSQF